MKNNSFHSRSQTPTRKNEAVNVPSVPEFPEFRPRVPAGLLFTPKQLASLFNRCEKDRRKRQGQGGGGSGGGYFLEPVLSCGYEEVEGGSEQYGCKVVGYNYVYF